MTNNQNNSNKRSRNRGKRYSNPANRVYESNGPDVKVKGTATHIADKYMALSRDALAVGDIIANESYAQHAEHYNRLAAAAAMYNQQQSLSQYNHDQKKSSPRLSDENKENKENKSLDDVVDRPVVEGGGDGLDKPVQVNGKRRKSRRMTSSSSRSRRDSASDLSENGVSSRNGSSSVEGDSLADILPTSKTD